MPSLGSNEPRNLRGWFRIISNHYCGANPTQQQAPCPHAQSHALLLLLLLLLPPLQPLPPLPSPLLPLPPLPWPSLPSPLLALLQLPVPPLPSLLLLNGLQLVCFAMDWV